MFRLKEDHVEEFEVKKSKFQCYLHTCFSEEDAKSFIAQIKKTHPYANHQCYAYIIGEQNEIQRSNDDGEPSGTAGSPMLECLAHQKMQDIIAVTVRYFGGIKLGGGGLIRAYSKSVSIALQGATKTRKVKMFMYELIFSYDLIGKLDYHFRTHNIEILDKHYEELVMYRYICASSIDDEISMMTNGKFIPKFIKEVIIDLDINE